MRKIVSLLMMLVATTCITLAVSPPAVLISRDSMRTKWVNGKKFLMHKVAKGETFYSISRDYKVDVKELMNANKGVTQLKTGQIIHVPVSENFVASAKQTDETVKTPDAVNVHTDEKPATIEAKPVTKTVSNNIYHKVKKGETLSIIARKYNVTVEEISDLNNLKKNQININQKLLVKKESKEVTEEAIVKKTNESEHHYGVATKYHTVAKGESLYGISKKYGAETNDLVAWNDLKGTSIKTGQKLIVQKEETTQPQETVHNKIADAATTDAPKTAEVEKKVSDVKEVSETKPEAVKNEAIENSVDNVPPTVNTSVIDKTPSGKNIKQSIETGEAAWVNDGELTPNKYFALHRTAPTGTIMKVTNRMNGKYVFVKVIGKLPGTGDNESLIIKISKAASERLGVLDQTFQCELNYAFAAE